MLNLITWVFKSENPLPLWSKGYRTTKEWSERYKYCWRRRKGAESPGAWQYLEAAKQRNAFSPGASRKECNPTHTLTRAQWDLCWTSNLQSSGEQVCAVSSHQVVVICSSSERRRMHLLMGLIWPWEYISPPDFPLLPTTLQF